MRRAAILLEALLVAVLLPTTAAAQATATSFAGLVASGVLEEGKDITITFQFDERGGYEAIDAEVVSLSESAIVILLDSLPKGTTALRISRAGRRDASELEIPENRVQRIVLKGEGMARWVGGMIGGGAGLVGTGVMIGACINANETGDGCSIDNPGLLSLAMIGGGVAVGALLSGESAPETVYESGAIPAHLSSSPQWSFAPVLVKGRKAAVFTIRW